MDDAIVRLADDKVEVSIGNTRVGELGADDASRYAPVLELAGRPPARVEWDRPYRRPCSHVKLYLPSPEMLLPANVFDPSVPRFPAHDRAGGATLARRKSDHTLIETATASWWSGTSRSVWVVLTRSGTEITATIDGLPLPRLNPDRTSELQSVWDLRHPEQERLQLEAHVYEIKAGRQMAILHQYIW